MPKRTKKIESPETKPEYLQKKTKRSLNLKIKLEILQLLDSGSSASTIGRKYDLNESTIRTIKNGRDKILDSIKHGAPLSVKVAKYARKPLVVKMEKILFTWIDENNKNQVCMNTNAIKNKALNIFKELKEKEGDDDDTQTFTASKGWFDRMKQRFNLTNVKCEGKSSVEYSNDADTSITDDSTSIETSTPLARRRSGTKTNKMRTFIHKEKSASDDEMELTILELTKNDTIDLNNENEEIEILEQLESEEEEEEEKHQLIEFIEEEQEEEEENINIVDKEEEEEEMESLKVEEEMDEIEESSPKSKKKLLVATDFLTTENLKEAIGLVNKAVHFFGLIDPDSERSTKIGKGLQKQIEQYVELLKQRTIKEKRQKKQNFVYTIKKK